ncbi:exodeoxyribonuclease VII large subunit [Aquabacterium sp. A08]|uniref:exodeoxyribonuclease VII large subunit n=1 Tax=Aquabacterium sp. A08 TaxID=2718532 RepID=UPI00141ED4BD|nr:exodeoxyribonuclease VII large subunit [Aquabacterium sp. A08]NIC40517.1 exodeoxyribonuclease VII large subunit [Aquabacterium sp. A08]
MFDAPAPPPARTGGATVWGVGALLRALADALQARFNPVTVRGEVSGFARAASGHCYFTLKDEQGQIRCAMFRRAAQASGLDLRDGQTVEAQGRLDVYGPRGDLQLIVEGVRLAGQGNLYEQFLRLKAELEAEGCFDAARKRPLPPLPRSIAVVTSLDAAALRDVVTTLQRRVPHLPVTVFPSPVQGDAAPAALCRALDAAYARYRASGTGEVLLLVRGGGSLEDLWAFNSPLVVRKLVEAPMPVVCGVGHETDFTLADFAADLRAPTPTGAAELCAPGRDTLVRALALAAERLQQAAWRRLDGQSQRLDRLGQSLGRPSGGLARERSRLQASAHRLQRAVALRLDRDARALQRGPQALAQALRRDHERRRQRLDHLGAQLALLDPRLVLQRGYALLADDAGRLVSSVQAVQAGQALHAQLADGVLELTVRPTNG